MAQGEPYAIPLPEKLQPDGPWNVYRYLDCFVCLKSYYAQSHSSPWCANNLRCATSPRKLLSNFEAPDQDVFTLYDNWETAVARYPHVRCCWAEAYGLGLALASLQL